MNRDDDRELSTYAFTKYGDDAKLWNGIHDLESELITARKRLERLRRPIPKVRRKPRRGPMRSKEYRLWLRRRHCPICALGVDVDPWKFKRSEPAHTERNGMSSKGPDSSCAPLCRAHHREYDRNRKAFERKYGVDMRQLAKEHYEKFLRETG
jgi:hypothetical protein